MCIVNSLDKFIPGPPSDPPRGDGGLKIKPLRSRVEYRGAAKKGMDYKEVRQEDKTMEEEEEEEEASEEEDEEYGEDYRKPVVGILVKNRQ